MSSFSAKISKIVVRREMEELREGVRSGEYSPCAHGCECSCKQREQWEWAVERVYLIERREETLTDIGH